MLARHHDGGGAAGDVSWRGRMCLRGGGTATSTIAEQYAAEGLALAPANDDRVNGAAEVLQLLGDERQPAKLFVSRALPVVDGVFAVRWSMTRIRPEDVLKVDIDEDGNGGDDAYDGLRYGLMARPAGSFVMRYA
jgi:hypothetical protein